MFRRTTATLLTALVLGGCSLSTGDDDEGSESSDQQSVVPGSTVVLVTHGDFALPKELLRKFETETGLKLKVRAIDEGLPTQLALTQDNPLGDAAFGVDNGFASLTLGEDVFADYQADLPEGAEEYLLDGRDSDRLTPVDHGEVCVNIDKTWYAAHDQQPPTTLADLADPAYANQFVLPGATGSTTGFLFLLATIDEFGDGWEDYWSDLMHNGADVTKDWSDAYFGGFTGGNPDGDRPIVVSYDTSPPYTLDKKTGDSTTAALLDTCIPQVEYAGVLENANNPAAARLLVDFLVSPEVQQAIPSNMYMFPVDDTAPLPKDWVAHADQPSSVYPVDADEVADHRQEWLTSWRDVISR